MKIAYFCTTFPVLSETFLQREIKALLEREDISLTIFSLWKGEDSWEKIPVKRIPKWTLVRLFWLIPYWTAKKPKAVLWLLGILFKRRPSSWLNFGENMLGLGLGILLAQSIERMKPDVVHAAWASMPAASALTLHKLLNIPFTMGAHAYDIFENNGDWLLTEKAHNVKFIQTSTESAAQALHEKLQGEQQRITLIRRGLNTLPPLKPLRQKPHSLRFISIGRLVEKKGYDLQLNIYAILRDAGLNFEVKIAGSGPLKARLEEHCKRLQLENHIQFLGAQSQQDIQGLYSWADYMTFTGVIAANGDRDGLPNVIPEAMASGVIVLASPGAGTQEAITHQATGLIAAPQSPKLWLKMIQELESDMSLKTSIQENARHWVEENFDARKNTALLCRHFEEATKG